MHFPLGTGDVLGCCISMKLNILNTFLRLSAFFIFPYYNNTGITNPIVCDYQPHDGDGCHKCTRHIWRPISFEQNQLKDSKTTLFRPDTLGFHYKLKGKLFSIQFMRNPKEHKKVWIPTHVFPTSSSPSRNNPESMNIQILLISKV